MKESHRRPSEGIPRGNRRARARVGRLPGLGARGCGVISCNSLELAPAEPVRSTTGTTGISLEDTFLHFYNSVFLVALSSLKASSASSPLLLPSFSIFFAHGLLEHATPRFSVPYLCPRELLECGSVY